MKHHAIKILAATVVLSLLTSAGRAQENQRDEFERKVDLVNEKGRKKDMLPVALKTVSIETGVPLDRVETMYRRHPKPGPAGILTACVLAAETKVEPEQFLENRTKGKGWVAQAREHNVPVSKINDRLDHMLRFLDDPNKVEKAKREARKDKKQNRDS